MNGHTQTESRKYSFGQVALAVLCAVALVAAMMPNVLGRAYASSDETGQSGQSADKYIPSQASEDAGDFAAATPNKEEVVYVKLSPTGALEGAYVVNGFTLEEASPIADPGTYSSVTNLSTNETLKNEKGLTKAYAPKGEFFYEGELDANTELPWNVEINYALDGKKVSAEDLAGAHGALSIELKITPQKEGESIFADNYLVQASGSFSDETASNLEAAEGTVATAGSNRQVTFMALPGEGGTFTITAQVTDFSFDGFTIAAIPLSMALDTDNFQSGELTSNVNELKDAVAQIDDGATSLKSASDKIAEGVALLASNNQTLSEGSALTLNGVEQLNSSSAQLAQGSSEYLAAAKRAEESAKTGADGLQRIADAKQSAYGAAMTDAQTNLKDASEIDLEKVKMALKSGDPEKIKKAEDDLDDLKGHLGATKTSLSEISNAVAGTKADPGLVSYQAQASAAAASGETAGELAANYAAIDGGIQQLNAKLPEMRAQYALFNDGLQSYLGGVAALNNNYARYDEGLQAYKQGTSEFKNQTVDIDQKILDGIKEKLTDYLDPQYELHSFVEPSNTHVDRVQFIYMSEPIEKPSEKAPEPEEPEEENIWTRFLAIFGL